MSEILKRIKTNSSKEPKSICEMALKLCEESGEVAQATLSYTEASGSAYKKLDENDVAEECTDVIIVAISLFYKLGFSTEDMIGVLDTKLDKWEVKMKG